MQTNWIPPTLCGCVLQITADFLDGAVVDGVAYQHPKPYTVTDVQIVSVCPTHKPVLSNPIDETVFMDSKGNQVRGYLKYPITNPTDAETLYSYLWRYSGTSHRPDTCDCKAYLFNDRLSDSPTYKQHPKFSKVCDIHTGDKDHSQCIADLKQVNDVKAQLIISNPELHTPVYSEDDKNKITQALLTSQPLPTVTPTSYVLNGEVTLQSAGVVSFTSPLLTDVASSQILSSVQQTLLASNSVIS